MNFHNNLKTRLMQVYVCGVSERKVVTFRDSLIEIINDYNRKLIDIVNLTDEFESECLDKDNRSRVISVVLGFLTVNKPNAERLFTFFRSFKNEDAYCLLYRNYWSFLTDEHKAELNACDTFATKGVCRRWKTRREKMCFWRKDYIEPDEKTNAFLKERGIKSPESIQGFNGYFSFNFGDVYLTEEVNCLMHSDAIFKDEIEDCLKRFRNFDYGFATEEEKELNAENRLFFGINFQLIGRYETEKGEIIIEVPDFEVTEISFSKGYNS